MAKRNNSNWWAYEGLDFETDIISATNLQEINDCQNLAAFEFHKQKEQSAQMKTCWDLFASYSMALNRMYVQVVPLFVNLHLGEVEFFEFMGVPCTNLNGSLPGTERIAKVEALKPLADKIRKAERKLSDHFVSSKKTETAGQFMLKHQILTNLQHFANRVWLLYGMCTYKLTVMTHERAKQYNHKNSPKEYNKLYVKLLQGKALLENVDRNTVVNISENKNLFTPTEVNPRSEFENIVVALGEHAFSLEDYNTALASLNPNQATEHKDFKLLTFNYIQGSSINILPIKQWIESAKQKKIDLTFLKPNFTSNNNARLPDILATIQNLCKLIKGLKFKYKTKSIANALGELYDCRLQLKFMLPHLETYKQHLINEQKISIKKVMHDLEVYDKETAIEYLETAHPEHLNSLKQAVNLCSKSIASITETLQQIDECQQHYGNLPFHDINETENDV